MSETLTVYILSIEKAEEVPTEAMKLALHKSQMEQNDFVYFSASDAGVCDYYLPNMSEKEKEWLEENATIIPLR